MLQIQLGRHKTDTSLAIFKNNFSTFEAMNTFIKRLQQPTASMLHTLIMVFIWVLVFMLPVLLGDYSDYDIRPLTKILVEYGVLFILFVVNRLMIRHFMKSKRWKTYFTLLIVAISVAFVTVIYFENKMTAPQEMHMAPPPREHHMERSAQDGQDNATSAPQDVDEGNRPPPGDSPPTRRGPRPPRPQSVIMPPMVHLSIFTFLILGLDILLFFSLRWMNAAQERTRLAKENAQMQLAFLQQQVSPHLFMNTLNNIHALIDIDAEKAQHAVIQLSQLMSFLIYESTEKQVKLKDEIDFIDNYIALMRLRFPSRVDIQWVRPSTVPSNIVVPPLLYISAIENAFKHGVSYQQPSHIYISMHVIPDIENATHLELVVENSKFDKVAGDDTQQKLSSKENHNGLGLKNMRSRLDMLYNDNYTLVCNNDEDTYTLEMSIPLDLT